jgi:hypothetical protein
MMIFNHNLAPASNPIYPIDSRKLVHDPSSLHVHSTHSLQPQRISLSSNRNHDPDPEHFWVIVNGFTRQVAACCLETLSWHTFPSLLQQRHNPGAAVHAKRLYMVGGFDGNIKCLANIEEFDFSSLQWKSLPLELAIPRSDCAVCGVDDKLIVTGGWDGSMYLDSVEILNLCSLTCSMLPPMNAARSGCGAALHHNHLLIVLGGYSRQHGHLSSGEVFDFNTQSWSPFPVPLLRPRAWFGLKIENEQLFVYGGQSQSKCVEVFDISSQRWTQLGQVPLLSSSLSAWCSTAMEGGKMYVCRGHAKLVYDIESDQWSDFLPSHPSTDINCYLSHVVSFVVTIPTNYLAFESEVHEERKK